MSNNNTPTAPGWYYRDAPDGVTIIEVKALYDALFYSRPGDRGIEWVEDDGLWIGPVPMPGEWVPREIADCLYYEALGVDNNDSELLRRYEEFIGDEE